MTTLRAALIGCGRVSTFHVEALQALEGVEIVGVCDLDEELAALRAVEAGGCAVFTDAEAMMAELQPDVVHILTPPGSHLALARIVAGHAAHMYVEKPLASSTEDAEAIVETARAAGVSLCTGHSRLFDPPFLEARRRIDAGEIGRVLGVRSDQGFTYEGAARSATIPWSYTYGWGIFENLMPHALSVACDFLDDPGEPVVVGSNAGCVREAAVDEIRAVIPSRTATAEVSLSLCNAPEVNRLEVIGTRGRLVVDFNSLTVLGRSESGLPGAVTRFAGNFGAALRLTGASTKVAAGIVTGKVKRYMGLRLLVEAFYQSLRDGAPAPVTPEDALVVMRLMDSIREACAGAATDETPAVELAHAGRPARVLVTGASGFLGRHLVRRLAADGPVRATTRLASRAEPIAGVEWVECDLTSEDDLRRAVTGIETVYHCAAMAGAPGSLEDYHAANVAGTVRLAELCADAGVEKLVYMSSLSVYGLPPRGTRYLDEAAAYDDRAGERGAYTQTKLAAERELLEFARAHDRPTIVALRAGTIYGPGGAVPIGRLRLPSSNRRPLVAGGRAVPMPLTYVENLVDALLAAAEHDLPSGRVYNIVDSAEMNQGDVADELRRASGGRIRPVFVPRGLVWLLMAGFDLVSRGRSGAPGTARFRFKRTVADMRYECAAARSELGWQPRVSLREGLKRTLEPS